MSPDAVVGAEERGEQHAPPLSSRGAVYPVAHRTRNSPLKAATDAMETAEGHDVVLLLTPEQLLRKRDRCFRLPAGCPEGPWPSDTVALTAINRWASDHTKVGGSWGVTWLKGVDKGNTARGRQHALGCDQQKRQHC